MMKFEIILLLVLLVTLVVGEDYSVLANHLQSTAATSLSKYRTFIGSDGKTICKYCPVHCMRSGIFSSCEQPVYHYGCHVKAPCLTLDRATHGEIGAAVVMCQLYAKCVLKPQYTSPSKIRSWAIRRTYGRVNEKKVTCHFEFWRNVGPLSRFKIRGFFTLRKALLSTGCLKPAQYLHFKQVQDVRDALKAGLTYEQFNNQELKNFRNLPPLFVTQWHLTPVSLKLWKAIAKAAKDGLTVAEEDVLLRLRMRALDMGRYSRKWWRLRKSVHFRDRLYLNDEQAKKDGKTLLKMDMLKEQFMGLLQEATREARATSKGKFGKKSMFVDTDRSKWNKIYKGLKRVGGLHMAMLRFNGNSYVDAQNKPLNTGIPLTPSQFRTLFKSYFVFARNQHIVIPGYKTFKRYYSQNYMFGIDEDNRHVVLIKRTQTGFFIVIAEAGKPCTSSCPSNKKWRISNKSLKKIFKKAKKLRNLMAPITSSARKL